MSTKTVTVSELAEALKVHPKTVRRMIERNELPRPRRIAGRIRFAADEIEGWFERLADSEAPARATA